MFSFLIFMKKFCLHENNIWFIFSNKYCKSSISAESFSAIIPHKVPTTKEVDECAKNRLVKLIFRFFYFQIKLTFVIIFRREIVEYHIIFAKKTSTLHFCNSDDFLRYGYIKEYLYLSLLLLLHFFSSNFIPFFYYSDDNENTNNVQKQLLLKKFVIYFGFFSSLHYELFFFLVILQKKIFKFTLWPLLNAWEKWRCFCQGIVKCLK